jgi:hypothetical protein
MSLIRGRRERREHGHGRAKRPSIFRLVLLLVIVVGLIWYLGRFT